MSTVRSRKRRRSRRGDYASTFVGAITFYRRFVEARRARVRAAFRAAAEREAADRRRAAE